MDVTGQKVNLSRYLWTVPGEDLCQHEENNSTEKDSFSINVVIGVNRSTCLTSYYGTLIITVTIVTLQLTVSGIKKSLIPHVRFTPNTRGHLM